MKEKKLGIMDLVSIGVGSCIGAGIFSMLGTGIYYGGRGITLAVVLAMFIVFLEYIRSPILSATFVLPGGSYDQSALTLPPFFTGAGALITIISNLSLSVFGISIVSYLAQLVPSVGPYDKLLAFLITTVFFAVSIPGSKFLARIQNIMVLLMYVALVLFVIFGIINYNPAVTADPLLPQGPVGLLIAVAMMSFTCNGITNVINLTADTENPKKNIPLSMILATVICAALYGLLGFASTAAIPYAEVAGQNMGFIAQRVMPSGLYIFFVVGGAIFALATSLLGGVSALKWPILASAKDGWLPNVFTKETKNGFPWVVMLTMYLIAVIPILGGFSLESIVSLIMVPAAILSIAGNLINWNLPKKFPKAWAENSWHLSATAFHILMVLSTIAALLIAVFTLSTQSLPAILGNLGMTAFLFIFGYFRYKSGKVHLAARDIYSE